MNTSRSIVRAVTSAALVIAATAAVAVWHANQVKAFNPQPDPPALAYVGIVFSQTARLSVVTDAEVSPGPCR